MLQLNPALIEAAAENSSPPPAPLSRKELLRAVKGLSAEERDAWFIELIEDQTGQTGALLRRTLHAAANASTAKKSSAPKLRMFATIERRADELQAQAKQRAEEAAAHARKLYLQKLADRESAAWKEIEQMLATKATRQHDQAIKLLADLSEMGRVFDRKNEVQRRIEKIYVACNKRPAIRRRIEKAHILW